MTVYDCNDCVHCSPNEKEQSDRKEPHFCMEYGVRVMHKSMDREATYLHPDEECKRDGYKMFQERATADKIGESWYCSIPLTKGFQYKVNMRKGEYKETEESYRHYNRTLKNLQKMASEGRPVTVINPSKNLSKSELEQFRAYFCKKAKMDRMNYIYFMGPIMITWVGDWNVGIVMEVEGSLVKTYS